MTRHLLTLFTVSVTLLLLAVLALPAVRSVRAGTTAAQVTVAATATPDAPRPFGVYVDPSHLGEWEAATGTTATMSAKFLAFSATTPVETYLRQVAAMGIRTAMLTWEPWRPVATSLGTDAQHQPQPGYRNVDIAAGAQDAYILKVARSLARFPGTMYVRYAHEMNGTWYPWSHGPVNYVRAWRHVVRLVDSVAPNVRFIWSVNPSLYEPRVQWRMNARRYWPGRAYVDQVGTTMINFGGTKEAAVRRFQPRIRELRRFYRLPVMLTEVNTAWTTRLFWLRDLRAMLAANPWISGVTWSQLPSRGASHLPGAGNLSWDVQQDPQSSSWLRAIATDLRR